MTLSVIASVLALTGMSTVVVEALLSPTWLGPVSPMIFLGGLLLALISVPMAVLVLWRATPPHSTKLSGHDSAKVVLALATLALLTGLAALVWGITLIVLIAGLA